MNVEVLQVILIKLNVAGTIDFVIFLQFNSILHTIQLYVLCASQGA